MAWSSLPDTLQDPTRFFYNFTARRYASVVVRLSVRSSERPTVCPRQAGIVSKRLDVESWFWLGSFL